MDKQLITLDHLNSEKVRNICFKSKFFSVFLLGSRHIRPSLAEHYNFVWPNSRTYLNVQLSPTEHSSYVRLNSAEHCKSVRLDFTEHNKIVRQFSSKYFRISPLYLDRTVCFIRQFGWTNVFW